MCTADDPHGVAAAMERVLFALWVDQFLSGDEAGAKAEVLQQDAGTQARFLLYLRDEWGADLDQAAIDAEALAGGGTDGP